MRQHGARSVVGGACNCVKMLGRSAREVAFVQHGVEWAVEREGKAHASVGRLVHGAMLPPPLVDDRDPFVPRLSCGVHHARQVAGIGEGDMEHCPIEQKTLTGFLGNGADCKQLRTPAVGSTDSDDHLLRPWLDDIRHAVPVQEAESMRRYKNGACSSGGIRALRRHRRLGQTARAVKGRPASKARPSLRIPGTKRILMSARPSRASS